MMQIQRLYKIIGKYNERFNFLTEQILENNKNITELKKKIDKLQLQLDSTSTTNSTKEDFSFDLDKDLVESKLSENVIETITPIPVQKKKAIKK